MLTTSQLRREWGPPCSSDMSTIALWNGTRVTVRRETIRAWHALDAVLHRWQYAPRRGVTGAFVCRKITGGSGYSLHAYGIAVDINWDKNPYGPRLVTDMPRGMIDEILALRTNNGQQVFGWGGYWRTNKDAMHYEVVCSRASLRTGIRQTRTGDDMAQVEQGEWDAMVARVTRLESSVTRMTGMVLELHEALIRNAPPNGETMAQQMFRAVDKTNHTVDGIAGKVNALVAGHARGDTEAPAAPPVEANP